VVAVVEHQQVLKVVFQVDLVGVDTLVVQEASPVVGQEIHHRLYQDKDILEVILVPFLLEEVVVEPEVQDLLLHLRLQLADQEKLFHNFLLL
jgi:hypothetical protein